ncbi:MAG: hypothetical protein IJ045_00405 [Ruminiclostridium sp.]|nr:hypothetical protein [Ruminiclostridium sp.]
MKASVHSFTILFNCSVSSANTSATLWLRVASAINCLIESRISFSFAITFSAKLCAFDIVF